MKISKFIKLLEDTKNIHGDVDLDAYMQGDVIKKDYYFNYFNIVNVIEDMEGKIHIQIDFNKSIKEGGKGILELDDRGIIKMKRNLDY